MDELNLKAFISIQQETIERYKELSTHGLYDYAKEISQHQDIVDALKKQIYSQPMYFDGLRGGLECPNCKTNVKKSQRYCSVCGQKIREGD